MIEVIWKGGAEQDLLRIFADLDDFREGAGIRSSPSLICSIFVSLVYFVDQRSAPRRSFGAP
jgi:hypothetical protein